MVFCISNEQPHFLKGSLVCAGAGCYINARGFHGRMPQNIREVCKVFFHSIKAAREQVAQVVRKYLLRLHMRGLAKPLHIMADIGSIQRFAVLCAEDMPALDAVLRGIEQKPAFQRAGEQHGAAFSLKRDFCLAGADGFQCNVFELAYANAGGANRKHHKVQPFVRAALRRVEEPLIFWL